MTDVDHALAELTAIRLQMAASTRFRGFAPSIVAATGVLALAGAAAQSSWPAALASGPVAFAGFWSVIGVAAGGMIAVEALGRSYRLHGVLADVMVGGTMRLFLPFGVAGALITLVFMRAAPEACRLLPGLWQMLIALLGFTAASTSLPRSLIWGAGWYLACATVVLLLAASQDGLSPWLMGVPFGGGQLLIAWLLHRAAEQD
mgnify:CR=1 FL=1